MDYTQARKLAEEKLEELKKLIGKELLISTSEPHADKGGWLFFYNTKTAIETQNPLYGLAGNGPIFVSKNGVVKILGSAEYTYN